MNEVKSYSESIFESRESSYDDFEMLMNEATINQSEEARDQAINLIKNLSGNYKRKGE